MPRSYAAIITTYNRPALVRQAIASALGQSHGVDQIIVVLDNGDEAMGQSLREDFPSITVFVQPNYGVAAARNAGVALATTQYVAFLDDDDLWHCEKIAATDAYLEQHAECVAVNHPVWWFSEQESGPMNAYGFKRDFVATNLAGCHAAIAAGDPSTNSFEYLKINGKSFRALLERNCGALSGTVLDRRTFIAAGGFCPMHAAVDDWNMFLNVARLTEWHTIPRRLTFCRLHEAQESHQPANGLQAIAGLVNSWMSGRPMPQRVYATDVPMRLAEMGPVYRTMVQNYVWGALFSGQWRIARLSGILGRLLLPRWRDRLYIFIPPQITWRIERHLFGMHQ